MDEDLKSTVLKLKKGCERLIYFMCYYGVGYDWLRCIYREKLC